MTMKPEQGCAWVTGASSGIGAAVALRLARDGWRVVVSARGADKLAALAEGSGGRIVPMAVDLTDRDAVLRAVPAIEAAHGPIALAVLNAGTYKPDRAETFSSADFRMHVEINLMGTAYCLEALLPAMIGAKRGQIAVVSSVAGYRGLPTSIAYRATKAALINMTEALKFDLDRHGIKIQIVNPGFVRTPLTDRNTFKMPALMEVEDAADRLVEGLKRDSFEIAFPRRFTFWLQRLRCLPYKVYFPLVARATEGK